MGWDLKIRCYATEDGKLLLEFCFFLLIDESFWAGIVRMTQRDRKIDPKA